MKKHIIFLLLVALGPGMNSQENYRPGMKMGVYAGLAVSMGDFADRHLADWNEHCGCAGTAGAVSLLLRARVRNNLWGVFGFQGTLNPYNPEPLANALHESFNAPFAVQTDSWKSRIIKLDCHMIFFYIPLPR